MGTSASITALIAAGLQVQSTGANAYTSIGRWDNNAANPGLIFNKSRGGSVGTLGIVQTNDSLGELSFTGDDGSAFVYAARIQAQVDGTPGTNDMPGRLVFSTTADGAASPTERMRITSAGLVGIGTTSPGGRLQINIQDGFLFDVGAGAYTYMRFGSQTTAEGVAELAFDRGAGAVALKIGNTGSTLNTRLSIDAAGATIINNQSGTERARIDSSGRLLVGTSSARANYFNATVAPQLQVEGGASGEPIVSVVRNANDVFPSHLLLSKTRGTGNVIVADGDTIGSVGFQGSDGAEFVPAASISAQVDGAPGTNVMPGRLVFSTTSTTAGASPTERMRITSAGLVGIGTISPAYALDVQVGDARFKRSASDDAAIYFGSTTNNYIFGSNTGNLFVFATNGSERARIDSSGRLLVGTSTARSNFFGTTLSAVTQTEGTGGAAGRGSLSVINNDVSNNPPYVLLGRSGAATLGSNAAVVSGSRLGTLTFHGADGTNFVEAATVAGEVDGTPGTNDMPGRLVFSTTADGAASPTERMRITSAGLVGIGTASPGEKLHIQDSTTKGTIKLGLDYYGLIQQDGNNLNIVSNGDQEYRVGLGTNNGSGSIVFKTSTGALSNTERARIDSSGRLLVGTSTARANYYSSVTPGGIQSEAGTQSLFQNSNNATGPALYLGKSRGATVNSNTVVQADDQLGALVFFGADGTNVWPGAQITAAVDGTPGTNDMPGRLVFLTTADGAASPTERMRIKSTGIVNIANTPTYADNAAATAGGLVAGDIYRTSTGQLMIRY